MKLRLVMVSGDRQALKAGTVQRRLMQLADRIGELYVIVPTSRYKQQLNSNAWVYGSGGANKLSQWFSTIILAIKLIRSHNCQVVTSQDPFELGLVAYISSRWTRAKLHLQDHSAFLGNELFRRISVRRWLQYYLGYWLVRQASRIRTVSQRGARGLIAVGFTREKIDIIPIPSDVVSLARLAVTRKYLDKEIMELVYIGRLEQEKGVDILIRALHPTWHLTIVGSGSMEKSLRLLADTGGASISWAGQQSDLKSYLANADIAVLPSLTEGWGLFAIEAAASGLPLVMTNVGCAGELLKDGESALVVAPNDPTALSAAIDRLSADAELRQRLGQTAKQIITQLPAEETLYQLTANSYIAAI